MNLRMRLFCSSEWVCLVSWTFLKTGTLETATKYKRGGGGLLVSGVVISDKVMNLYSLSLSLSVSSCWITYLSCPHFHWICCPSWFLCQIPYPQLLHLSDLSLKPSTNSLLIPQLQDSFKSSSITSPAIFIGKRLTQSLSLKVSDILYSLVFHKKRRRGEKDELQQLFTLVEKYNKGVEQVERSMLDMGTSWKERLNNVLHNQVCAGRHHTREQDWILSIFLHIQQLHRGTRWKIGREPGQEGRETQHNEYGLMVHQSFTCLVTACLVFFLPF